MKKYFYNDGTNNIGPFTFEELKDKGITAETYVWFEGLEDWKKAGVVSDLNELFPSGSTGVRQDSSATPGKKESSRRTMDILILILLAYWLTERLLITILLAAAPQWYNLWVKYLNVGFNLIFAFSPIVFALSVRNKVLKIIAIVLCCLISFYLLYSNVEWLVRELNKT